MSNSTQPLRAPLPAQPAQRLPARTLQLPCAPSWVAALEPVTSARDLARDEFAWIEVELPNAAALPERAFAFPCFSPAQRFNPIHRESGVIVQLSSVYFFDGN